MDDIIATPDKKGFVQNSREERVLIRMAELQGRLREKKAKQAEKEKVEDEKQRQVEIEKDFADSFLGRFEAFFKVGARQACSLTDEELKDLDEKVIVKFARRRARIEQFVFFPLLAVTIIGILGIIGIITDNGNIAYLKHRQKLKELKGEDYFPYEEIRRQAT